MRLLLDTHILLWGAIEPERLSVTANALIEDPDNEITFSVVSALGGRDQDRSGPRRFSYRRRFASPTAARQRLRRARDRRRACRRAGEPPSPSSGPVRPHARRPGDGRGRDPGDRRSSGGEISGTDSSRVTMRAWPNGLWRLDSISRDFGLCRRFRISMESISECTFESTRRPVSTPSTASSKRMSLSMRAKSSKAVCRAAHPDSSENGP